MSHFATKITRENSLPYLINQTFKRHPSLAHSLRLEMIEIGNELSNATILTDVNKVHLKWNMKGFILFYIERNMLSHRK